MGPALRVRGLLVRDAAKRFPQGARWSVVTARTCAVPRRRRRTKRGLPCGAGLRVRRGQCFRRRPREGRATRARAKRVAITTVQADLSGYALGHDTWNAIVSIRCHRPLALRERVHHGVGPALRIGGVFLLEAHTPAQLEFKTGEPPTAEPMPALAGLRAELSGLTFEFAIERERDVHEGRGHDGRSAVVQIIARRSG